VKTIDELLALAAEGDEEAQTEIRTRFQAVERDKAVAARDLKLKTDPKIKERYPRALRAYEKGKLTFTDDQDEAAVLEALRDQEDYLAEMGVPVETSASTPVVAAVVESGDGANDPAQALSGGRAASSPGGQPRDLVAEWADAMKGSTIHDQARAHGILVELNQSGQKDKIAQITRSLEARPASPTGI
jgi:hypothetical protein